MLFKYFRRKLSDAKKRWSGADFEKQLEDKSTLEFLESKKGPPASFYAWGPSEEETSNQNSLAKDIIDFDSAFEKIDAELEQADPEKRSSLSEEFFDESNPDLMKFLEPAIRQEDVAEESSEVMLQSIPLREKFNNPSYRSIAEHRKSVIYDKDTLLEKAKNQLEKAKDSNQEDINVRKVMYESAILQGEQAFALGNKDAAEFLMFANFGITDDSEEIITWDPQEFLKWKSVNDVMQDFADRNQDYMDNMVKDYGSVAFDIEAQKAFISKYGIDIKANNPNTNDETLEVAFSNALVCHISSEMKSGHSLSEWMEYLKEADAYLGMKSEIVDEYLAAHNINVTGNIEESEA